jgi:hypothetical protein
MHTKKTDRKKLDQGYTMKSLDIITGKINVWMCSGWSR